MTSYEHTARLNQSALFKIRSQVFNNLILQLLNSNNLSDKQTALQLLGINNDEQLELLEKEFHSRFEDKIELLEKIEASISQIEIGLYGTCAKCDENIEQSILNQHPYAQYCQSCQSEDTH